MRDNGPSLFLILLVVLGILSVGLAGYTFLVFLPQTQIFFALPPPVPLDAQDAHGCQRSLGYSWCPSLERCIRRSQQTCPTTFSDATLSAISAAVAEKLPQWISYWQGIIPGFSLASFRRIGQGALSRPTDAVADGYDVWIKKNAREKLFVYAPDTSKFVDPYAGQVSESGGVLRLERPEPDTSVWLVDTQNKKQERLLFCGTPCGFDDAAWLDNARFVVVWYAEYYPSDGEVRCSAGAPCTYVPHLNYYDLGKDTVTLFEGPETDTRPSEYLKKRFPDMAVD